MQFFASPVYIGSLLVSLFFYWGILRNPSHRYIVLILLSYFVLFFIHPIFCFFSLVIVFFLYKSAVKLSEGGRGKSNFFWSAVLSLLAFLLFCKYGGGVFKKVFIDADWVGTYILMPLGASYFCFRGIQYIFDSYRGIIKDHSYWKLLCFIMFLPTFPAGPIETYQSFYNNHSASFDLDEFVYGLKRITFGVVKKVFVLEVVFTQFWHAGLMEKVSQGSFDGSIDAMASVVSLFTYAYIDLSAYSDIAIGLSRLFGFKIAENFHYPLFKSNLSAFWRSWHISLSTWCRNNVYFPVFGYWRKAWMGLYASMLTMGLWHYLNLNWFLWGIYHASGLVIYSRWERYKRRRERLKKVMASYPMMICSWMLTFTFVAFGYSLVGSPNIETSMKIWVSIFSFGTR